MTQMTYEVKADLRTLPTEVRREIAPALKKAAKPMLADAKRRASWSTRIPAATRISVLKRGVEIRVSRRRAPHARPFEGTTRSGVFRHPVHGHRDRWVAQRVRPFLFPAVKAHRDKVRVELDLIVMRAARAHGFQ